MLPWPASIAHVATLLGQFLPGSAKVVSVIRATHITTVVALPTRQGILSTSLSSDAVLPIHSLYYTYLPVKRKATLTVLLEYLVLCNILTSHWVSLLFLLLTRFLRSYLDFSNIGGIWIRFLTQSSWSPSHSCAHLRS